MSLAIQSPLQTRQLAATDHVVNVASILFDTKQRTWRFVVEEEIHLKKIGLSHTRNREMSSKQRIYISEGIMFMVASSVGQ